MKFKTKLGSKQLVGLLLSVAMGACTTGKSGGWFSSEVPLADFKATNGKYFPAFVEKFFPGATYFTKDFPSISEARSEVRLIEVKKLTPAAEGSFNEANLSWSADGVYLSYESTTGAQRKIQVKDLVGNYSKDLLVMPTGTRDNFLEGIVQGSIHSYNAGLSWSTDSTRFAFMSNGGVGEYNIYVGAVGVKEAPVAKSPSKDGYATWSPKANELAFVSSRAGNADIFAINLDSNKLSQLTNSQKVDIFPNWYPNGSGLVYSGGDATNHDLFIVERGVGGSWQKPTKLTNWLQDDLRPTVSPDGKYVAFYATSPSGKRDDGKIWNIYVVPVVKNKTYSREELNEMAIANDVVVDLNTGPAWTPDSRRIFYVKHEPKVFNPIYAYDLFSGRRYTLDTQTRMNRDILMSKLGILSFRAQVGAWDRVFVALTNQGSQLQSASHEHSKIHYIKNESM